MNNANTSRPAVKHSHILTIARPGWKDSRMVTVDTIDDARDAAHATWQAAALPDATATIRAIGSSVAVDVPLA